MNPSVSGALNSADLKKWGKNLLIFLAPIVLIYLTSILDSIKATGVNLDSFVPNVATQAAMLVYGLNALIDIVRKLLAGPAITP